MACEKCPCPDICLARESFCAWAAEDPPVETNIRHICARSKIAHGIPLDQPAASQAGPAAFPPLKQQAASLARSLWDWATSGFSMASDEEVTRRRAICEGCPKWNKSSSRCTLCGCQTQYKTKMKTEHCPDKPPKW